MEKKKNMNALGYTLVLPIVRALIYLIFRPKVIGKENIPKDGPYVLAGNHTKWLDPVMLVSVANRHQVHFLAKEEMFHGISWIVVKAMGAIPVNRKIHDKDALISAYNYLNNGNVIGIFPEGTINRGNDWILPFKIGAVKMCQVTNCPLVPFVITGKYKWFGKGITVTFLKPRMINGELDHENEKFMKLISSKLEEFYEYNKLAEAEENKDAMEGVLPKKRFKNKTK